MNRRHLLQTSAFALASGLTSASALGPIERPGSPRLRLGLAAYSFRKYFKHQRSGKPPAIPEDEQIDMKDFIDFCANHGCDGSELTSYFFPQDIGEEALAEVARHAFLRGIDISGTAVGNNFTHPAGPERDQQISYVKGWIERAFMMGAPHIRVFAGRPPKDMSQEEFDNNVIGALRECGDFAGQRGIFLGIENHDSIGDHETLLRLINGVDHPWVGVNLDTGNFRTADPYVDMEKCAPYAVNVQVKVEMKRAGADEKEETDLARVVKILKDANYQGYVTLEYEAAENPYDAIPPLLDELRELSE